MHCMKSWTDSLRGSRIWMFLLVGSANTLIVYAIFSVFYNIRAFNYNIALASA